MIITAKHITQAMIDGLLIDSEASSETMRMKEIKFFPTTGSFVIYTLDESGDKDFEGRYSTDDVQDAVNNYNSYDVED